MKNTHFNDLVSRRRFLTGAASVGFVSFFNATGLTIKNSQAQDLLMNFKPVKANNLDTVTVPNGFRWSLVGSWGDPLWSGTPEFDHKSRGTGATQEMSVGDNNDGMAFFDIQGRHVLVVNNEYCNVSVIYGNRKTRSPENADDVRKGIAAHGVSIFEITRNAGGWRIVKDSPVNRRITAATPMELTGPASGHPLLKTALDPTGRLSLGTFNNCGNGRTPWGTYLTCEENFDKYFSAQNKYLKMSSEQKRYGLKAKDSGYGWARYHDRFDLGKHPNEANRVGYIVEIDPGDPTSTPKKRTAMGRFKHENCEIVHCKGGQIAAYMGDDQRGEFLYKFISKNRFMNDGKNTELLNEGELYVAIFEDSGNGRWVNLRDAGMSRAETLIFTRAAASRLGATTMDRPEWVSANPFKAEAYCCLTNNKNRGRITHQPLNAANPRADNKYGQIIRWKQTNNDHASDSFIWDHFVVAGNPTVYENEYAGSRNVKADNMFNSPDGLAFDTLGNLWIQTDGNYSNQGDFEGMGNNQMIMADPSTGNLKRFLVGPKECEVTGMTWSSDKSTMFVGIQHPGEKNPKKCSFPGGKGTVPRSSIIAISRDDGGVMG